MIGKAHGNAAAHGAGADDGRRLDVRQRQVFRQPGKLGHLTLGKKGIAQGFGFVGVLQLGEEPALRLYARIERLSGGRFHAGDAMIGRLLIARLARDGFAHGIEHAGVGFCLGELVAHVAHARQRPPVGDTLGVGDRLGAQVLTSHDLVHDAELLRLRGRHVAAGNDHLHRRLGADEARQALCAATTGQNADQDLRQPDLGAGHGDAVVAGQRMLEPAAERVAMDRGHHGLGAAIENIIDEAASASGAPCRTGGCRRPR